MHRISMALLRTIVVLLSLIGAAQADTLQDLLESAGIPAKDFTPDQLAAEVKGSTQTSDQLIFVLYGEVNRLNEGVLVGPRVLVRYDKASGAVTRGELGGDATESCGADPGELQVAGEYLLVETHINPSAGCTLVVDANLKLQKTLYGFSPKLISPNQLVIIEDMIHFAPVHPERLQLVDLTKWTDSELYPPKNDLLRRQLAKQHAAKMPSQSACTEHNEACEPDVFDEDIRSLTSDGKGRFAFVAKQSAAHVLAEGEESQKVASQSVFYLYQQRGTGWRYCQQLVKEEEAEQLANELAKDFSAASGRCTPLKVVYPDLKTQKYNPFIK